jgi:hypothetical protein
MKSGRPAGCGRRAANCAPFAGRPSAQSTNPVLVLRDVEDSPPRSALAYQTQIAGAEPLAGAYRRTAAIT